MTSLLEIRARAALCRQLAKREPNSKSLWLAEAERWSRLAQDVMPCDAIDPCQPQMRIARKIVRGGSHLCAPNISTGVFRHGNQLQHACGRESSRP
jgi:hypothetical protein